MGARGHRCDLLADNEDGRARLARAPPGALRLSVRQGIGVDELRARVREASAARAGGRGAARARATDVQPRGPLLSRVRSSNIVGLRGVPGRVRRVLGRALCVGM